MSDKAMSVELALRGAVGSGKDFNQFAGVIDGIVRALGQLNDEEKQKLLEDIAAAIKDH